MLARPLFPSKLVTNEFPGRGPYVTGDNRVNNTPGNGPVHSDHESLSTRGVYICDSVTCAVAYRRLCCTGARKAKPASDLAITALSAMATAVAARSNAGKAALAAGGVAVAGYGAYYMSNISQVKSLEKEKDTLSTKSFVAKGKFKRAENEIFESESLIKALQQQTDLDSRAITAITQELEAARLKVWKACRLLAGK